MISYAPEYYEIDDDTLHILIYWYSSFCCNVLGSFADELARALRAYQQRVILFKNVSNDYYVLVHDCNYQSFIKRYWPKVKECYCFPPGGLQLWDGMGSRKHRGVSRPLFGKKNSMILPLSAVGAIIGITLQYYILLRIHAVLWQRVFYILCTEIRIIRQRRHFKRC